MVFDQAICNLYASITVFGKSPTLDPMLHMVLCFWIVKVLIFGVAIDEAMTFYFAIQRS